jgi:hypothetical protein
VGFPIQILLALFIPRVIHTITILCTNWPLLLSHFCLYLFVPQSQTSPFKVLVLSQEISLPFLQKTISRAQAKQWVNLCFCLCNVLHMLLNRTVACSVAVILRFIAALGPRNDTTAVWRFNNILPSKCELKM